MFEIYAPALRSGTTGNTSSLEVFTIIAKTHPFEVGFNRISAPESDVPGSKHE
ncbi:hypothetical protein N9B24_00750 [bacterium]|nr:hypothetical protein [bacterium]